MNYFDSTLFKYIDLCLRKFMEAKDLLENFFENIHFLQWIKKYLNLKDKPNPHEIEFYNRDIMEIIPMQLGLI